MEKIKSIDKPFLFTENQRFRQNLIWVFVLLPATVSFFTLFYHLVLQKKSFGTSRLSDSAGIIILLLIGILLPILFFFTELRIAVTSDGIFVKFFPFHFNWKHIHPEEINSFKDVIYNPILEYGGWGIRYSRNGKAYNVSGNKGVLLTFKNGKKLLLGTQRPDELKNAIESTFKN